MKAVHKKRLLKLYEYMRQPQKKLGNDKFDFSVYKDYISCGTCGCMAGELPYIFPRMWEFDTINYIDILISVRLRQGQHGDRFSSKSEIAQLSEFFGISYDEASHLFQPNGQSLGIDPRSKLLERSATKRQVVANLRRFLKIKGIL